MKLGCDWRRSRNPTLQWKSLRRGCHTSRTSCMLCWEGAGSQAAGAAALLPTQPAPPGTSAFSSSLESPGDLERPEDLERPGDLKHRESPTWLVDPGDLRTLTPIPAPHPPPAPLPHSQASFADHLVSVLRLQKPGALHLNLFFCSESKCQR